MVSLQSTVKLRVRRGDPRGDLEEVDAEEDTDRSD